MHLRRICVSRVACLSALAYVAGHVRADGPFGVDKVSEWLDSTLNGLRDIDFDTTFEYSVLRPEGSREDWVFFESFRYVALGEELYTSRVAYRRPEDGSAMPQVKHRQENVWSNGAWVQQIEGEAGVSFYGRARPPDLQHTGFIFGLIDGRFSAGDSLSELVRRGRPVGESVSDGVLEYRFAVVAEDATNVQGRYTLWIQLQPDLAFLGYARELSDAPNGEPDHFDENVFLRTTYRVLEWEPLPGIQIPRVAQIESYGSAKARQKPPPLGARTVYARTSFRRISAADVDRSLFAVDLPNGTPVYDDRYKLSFQVGDRRLVVDGTVYELAEPLMEHPGDRLADLLREATPHHARPRSAIEKPGPSGAKSPAGSGNLLRDRRFILAGLAGAGGALVALAIIRARRYSQGSP